MVSQGQRRPVQQRVRRLVSADVHAQPSAAELDVEGEPVQPLGQARREPQPLAVAAHPAEARHQRHPGTGQRGDVQPVAGVVLQVLQIHQGRLGGVGVGEVEMARLGGDDGLAAGRQGGVPDGERLVVGEVAGDLVRAVGARPAVPLLEEVAAGVHGQHQVGLLDDLLAVEVEVGEVQQQRVLVGARAGEVPALVAGEPGVLLVHTQFVVVREVHRLGGVPPGGGLLLVHAEPGRLARVAFGGVGRGEQVLPGHEVGVGVVVGDRAVLVGAGDAVDVEGAVPVVMTQ